MTAPPTIDELLARVGLVARLDGATQSLPHNRRLTPGVWRVSLSDGRGAVVKYLSADRDPGETPWDAHWTAGDADPRRWNYWAREPLAYRDGVTEVYADAGLHAPACLGVEVGQRDAVLVLEWVDGTPGESWPVAEYAETAAALGRAQAPFLLGQALPTVGWLSRGFLRQYSGEKPVDFTLLDDDRTWQHPMVRATFPAQLRADVQFVHRHRERLYAISEALPQTLCHLDLWPKNLLRRSGDGQMVLLDWAFVGDGAIGEDIGNLIPDACFDHFVPAAQLPALEEIVFTAYLAGLRSAGWDGDPRLVQLGMWSAAVKYDWLAALTLAQVSQERQQRYGGEGEVDAAFKFAERSRALAFVARWARQAIELAQAAPELVSQ